MKSIIARLTCLPFMLTAQYRSSVSNGLNLSTRCAEVRPDRDHDGL